MKVIGSRVAVAEPEAAALSFPPRVREQACAGGAPAAIKRKRSAPEWHDYLLGRLNRWSIPALRIALGLIFLWFGALKLFGASPVTEILNNTYTFIPVQPFAYALGVWEVFVGAGLLTKRAMRCAVGLLCLHLAGTFGALALAPSLFFHHGNPLWLTVEGEFVMKNLVLIAAGLVLGGHEVQPLGPNGHTNVNAAGDDGR